MTNQPVRTRHDALATGIALTLAVVGAALVESTRWALFAGAAVLAVSGAEQLLGAAHASREDHKHG